MRGFKVETAAWAIQQYMLEETRFPTIAAIRQIAERRARKNIDSRDRVGADHQLEDKQADPPREFMNRLGWKDSKEEKAARFRQLRKYPSVLARHKESENW
jgi:hypothetical protein